MALMRSALKICPLKWCWSPKTCYGPPLHSKVGAQRPCRKRGGREREEGEEKKKEVWVRMQRSAPFHPEMFISLIPTEGKCTPLGLMVGWANFSRVCTHNTHTDKRESRESEGREGIKDDESKWGKRWEKYNCCGEYERKMGHEMRCFPNLSLW